MALITNIIEYMQGRRNFDKLFEDVLVYPTPAPGALGVGGCNPSSAPVRVKGSVSIPRASEDAAKTSPRVEIDQYVLVDDGDGRYTHANEQDRWERRGVSIEKSDPEFLAHLESMGLSPETLDGMRVEDIDTYAKAFQSNAVEIPHQTDEAEIWKRYQNIADVARDMNIASSITSPLYSSILALAGPLGCTIPIHMAQDSGEQGEVAQMNEELKAALTCSQTQHTQDQAFITRLGETAHTGYDRAIELAIEAGSSPETIAVGIQRLTLIEEAATAVNLWSEFQPKVQEARLTILNNALQEVAQDDSFDGNVEALEAQLLFITTAAEQVSMLPRIQQDLQKVRIDRYLKAIKIVEENEASRGEVDPMKEKLNAIAESAKRHRIDRQIRRELRRVWNLGYRNARRQRARGR